MSAYSVLQSGVTSDCRLIQLEGLEACRNCQVRDTKECGGGKTLIRFKRRYTIAEIAQINESKGHYYFSRDTLKFFGQRRKDFSIRHKNGRIFLDAPNRHGHSYAEFDPITGDVCKIPDVSTSVEYECFYQSVLPKGVTQC